MQVDFDFELLQALAEMYKNPHYFDASSIN